MRFNFQVSLLELKKATPTVQSAEMRTQWRLKPVAHKVKKKKCRKFVMADVTHCHVL